MKLTAKKVLRTSNGEFSNNFRMFVVVVLQCVGLSIVSAYSVTPCKAKPVFAKRYTSNHHRRTQFIPSTSYCSQSSPLLPQLRRKMSTNDDISFGESSRPFRRDVFGYDNWVQHRSTDRFIGNLLDILKSGVFRELLPYCFSVSSIATFVVIYNALFVNGYDDFAGIHHSTIMGSTFPLLKMPMDFFNLCTPSLALLLGTSLGYIGPNCKPSFVSLIVLSNLLLVV
jgi:hypothetical protein